MNAADRDTCNLFEYGLTWLRVDDEGCAPSDRADVMTCADLCLTARRATAGVVDVETLLLRRLILATEDLLTTYALVSPDNPLIVKRWLAARGELLECRIDGLR